MREGTGTRVAVPDDWVPCFQVRGLWDESGALAVTEPARRQTTSSVAQFLRSRMLGEAALISGSTAKVWIPSTDRCATPPPREKKKTLHVGWRKFRSRVQSSDGHLLAQCGETVDDSLASARPKLGNGDGGLSARPADDGLPRVLFCVLGMTMSEAGSDTPLVSQRCWLSFLCCPVSCHGHS